MDIFSIKYCRNLAAVLEITKNELVNLVLKMKDKYRDETKISKNITKFLTALDTPNAKRQRTL